jgi:hypothetical protein
LDIAFELNVEAVPEAKRTAVLSENFGRVGDALKKGRITASQYGRAAAAAGYAGPGTAESDRYEDSLKGTYDHTVGVLQRFAASLPSSVSPQAKSFLQAALAGRAKRQ